MGAPPAFNPPQRQSNNKLWLWLLLVVVLFCVLCIIGVFFLFKAGMNIGAGMISCTVNADLARTSVVAYTMENGKMPNADTWQSDIEPYYQRLYDKLHNEQGFNEMKKFMDAKIAKPGEVLECGMSGNNATTGFAFNSEFSGVSYEDMLKDTTVTIIWETPNPVFNANGNPKDRPADHAALKFYGDKRKWIDFPFTGKGDLFQSGDADVDIDLSPEDALPPDWRQKQANPTDSGSS